MCDISQTKMGQNVVVFVTIALRLPSLRNMKFQHQSTAFLPAIALSFSVYQGWKIFKSSVVFFIFVIFCPIYVYLQEISYLL